MTKIIDTLALSGFWVEVKTRLNNKADASHSHVIADVTSLQTLLDGKANSAHTHTIANVTGLQTALNGKSDTDHTHSLATTTTAGHMSGADKSKLDGIASGANNYSLPTASASVFGGVKVGSNLTIADGVLSATDTNTTYSAATTSTSGLMTPTDKVKLDGVAPNANNYAHPANHPPSIITQDANNRFVTDAEKSTWSDQASTVVQLRKDVNALSPLQIFANDNDEEGFLLKTDIPSWNQMVFGEIRMNSFSEVAYRKYTLQGFVNQGSFSHTRLWSESQAPLEISLYVIDGYIHVWLPKTRNYLTYYVAIRTINQSYSKNRIVSYTVQGKPTTSTIAIDLASSMSILPATPTVDGLYPKEHFAKVDAIPTSPKYTDTVTTINGQTGAITKSDITALGIPAQDTVYTHPDSHPASMITQDTSRRMVSDAQIANWDGNMDPVILMSETAFAGITPDPSKIYIVYGE